MKWPVLQMLTGILCLWILSADIEAKDRTDAGPDVIWIGLENGTDRESRMEAELRGLLRKYDLEPWILTRMVLIDQDQIPHSHPVLTIHTRWLGDKHGLLSMFVHEQLHWLEDEPWLNDFHVAMEAYERLFPEVPSSGKGGASSERSTYRHLLVCDMEYQVMTTLVGESAAREELGNATHYEWIYDRVLNDSRVREVALRYGFDVSAGVPDRDAADSSGHALE